MKALNTWNKRWKGLAALGSVCAVAFGSAGVAPAAERLEVIPEIWHLVGFENALDLSGIARANDRQVLVGSDEFHFVQPGFLELAHKRIASRPVIPLPVSGRGKREADIEGVTFSPAAQAYFVVGSHGVGKKKADFQPDRHAVHRLPVDPRTGEVRRDALARTSLLPWLERTPEVRGSLGQPLQQNGLNIEGLACRGNTLYFGLRAPHVAGRALVLEVDAQELFSGRARALTVHEIPVATGRGIRDLVALKEGFLLVTGNASAEASRKFPRSQAPGPDEVFELLHWDDRGDRAPRVVGTLPRNGGKAEALLVLEEEAHRVDLLVLFDGLPGGGPMRVRWHKGEAAQVAMDRR